MLISSGGGNVTYMKNQLETLAKSPTRDKSDQSSILVVYPSKEDGAWRGFVVPYDITFEAEDKEKVIEVLKDMTASYVDGLDQYSNPEHLSVVPLTYEPDKEKWNSISQSVLSKFVSKVTRKIESPDFYAEAQLSS